MRSGDSCLRLSPNLPRYRSVPRRRRLQARGSRQTDAEGVTNLGIVTMAVSVRDDTQITELFAKNRIVIPKAKFIALIDWERLTFRRPDILKRLPKRLNLCRRKASGGKRPRSRIGTSAA